MTRSAIRSTEYRKRYLQPRLLLSLWSQAHQRLRSKSETTIVLCSQHAESAVNKPVIPVVKPMKAFHVPSPPRLSDLRRKYGVAISAAGQSPAYSSTPSSSRSPSPLPARSPRAQSVQGTRKASPPKASQAAALKELKESLPAKLPATVTAKQPAQKSIPLVLEAEIEETEPAPRFLAPLVITAPAAVRPVSPAPVPAPVVKLPAQVETISDKLKHFSISSLEDCSHSMKYLRPSSTTLRHQTLLTGL